MKVDVLKSIARPLLQSKEANGEKDVPHPHPCSCHSGCYEHCHQLALVISHSIYESYHDLPSLPSENVLGSLGDKYKGLILSQTPDG